VEQSVAFSQPISDAIWNQCKKRCFQPKTYKWCNKVGEKESSKIQMTQMISSFNIIHLESAIFKAKGFQILVQCVRLIPEALTVSEATQNLQEMP